MVASGANAVGNVPAAANIFTNSFSLGTQNPKTNTNGLGLAKNADELVQRRGE